MPIRPRSHQLESESKAQFACVLPSNWVLRHADPDYGIDGQVEVFDVNNKATGLMFLIQLKATDALDLGDALSVQFKLDTLTYYRKLTSDDRSLVCSITTGFLAMGSRSGHLLC
jgi:hypothetical protein